VENFAAVRFAMDIFPPYIYQEVLADFMDQGHFGRHVRKMRQILGVRRNTLVDSIQKEFGDFLEVHGSDAGMHVSVTLPAGFNDREIAERASRERLWLWPLSRYYAGKRPRQGFVLGFGSTPTEQITAAVKRMRALVLGSSAD
jgi:GntR family transcriptional regulator/MocR family aminotransferase